jgi:hypothetical protein
MLLRKTFTPKWEEGTGGLRKLHRVSSRFILLDKSYIIRVMERRKMRNMYRILVGKSEREASFGRTKHLLEDGIERGLMEVGWEFVD